MFSLVAAALITFTMSSKRKPPSQAGRPAKDRKQQSFPCPNSLCKQQYATSRSLTMHLSKCQACADCVLSDKKPAAQDSPSTSSRDPRFPDDDSDSTDASDTTMPWGKCFDNPWDSSSDDSSEDVVNEDAAESESVVEVALPPDPETDLSCYGVSFTNSDFMETKLLKILNDAHAPHFLYQDLLNWAKEAKQSNYDFLPQRYTRKAQILHIEKWQKLQHCRPETIQLTLPGDGKVIPVTRFPFVNMLYTLLSDPVIMSDFSNLDVNPDNPFGKYESPGNYLSTVNSGSWYDKAYKNLVKDPTKDFLVPIVFACDETKLAKSGKTGCWPLLFTTTIFNQRLRNLSSSWRPLGYLYDLSIIESKAEKGQQSNEYKGDRLQAIFRVLLETLIEAQEEGALDNIWLTLGDQRLLVNLKIAVIFIIGDMQGGDKICCTAAAYSNKMSRLCRKCNVRGDQAGDPFVVCQRISMVKVKALVAANNVNALRKINQYNVDCAWFHVGFGGCRFGIFSAACPVEALHALENGLMSDCLNILFKEEMTPRQLEAMDKLAKKLSLLDRQRYLTAGSEPLMPRLRWADGISSLSDLEAKYRVGIMLTIVVLTLQDDGLALFTDVFDGSRARVAQMRQVFQMMLCYWMWLKKDKYWKRGDKVARQAARIAIQTMLHELMVLWPRTTGQGWEKAKVHEQLHVPDDIERNGSPKGWHSGPTENNHIASVKNYASQTNRRRETLDGQIATRNAESFIINSAYQRMTAMAQNNTECDDTGFPEGITINGSKALVYVFKDGRNYSSDPPMWNNTNQGPLHPWYKAFLETHYGSQPARPCCNDKIREAHMCVRISAEYTRGGVVFRAHPNYRKKGPWYDWAMFRWAKEGGKKDKNRSTIDSCVHYGDPASTAHRYTYAPGKILGFVFDGFPAATPTLANVQAVVHCCDSVHGTSSVFTTHWKMNFHDKACTKPQIALVNVQSIVRHCLMIPEHDGCNGFHEVWARERWGDQFSTE